MSSRQQDPDTDKAKTPTSPRAARLAEALRANLQKRKAQLRARRGGAEDGRKDGTLVTDGEDEA